MKRGSRIYLFFLVLIFSAYFIFALFLRLDEQFALYGSQGLRITAHGLEYGLLVFLAFLFGGVLFYFILSNAGKLSFKETYKGKAHFWITLASSLLCAAIAYFGIGYLYDPAFIENPSAAMPVSEPVVIHFSEKALHLIDQGAERSSQSYTIDQKDQSAFVIKNDASLELSQASIEKTGEYSGSEIFGTNAALVAGEESTVLVSNSAILTDAKHSDALAAYMAKININQSTLTTKQSGSPVLAAIESSVNLTSSTLSSTASNSPVLYQENGTLSLSSSTLQSQGKDSAILAGYGNCSLDSFQAFSSASPLADFTGVSQMEIHGLLGVFDGGNYPCLIHLKDSPELSNLTLTDSTIGPYDSFEAYAEIDPQYVELYFDQALFVFENANAAINLSQNNFALPSGTLANLSGSHVIANLNGQSLSGLINLDTASSLELNVAAGSVLSTAVNAESGPVSLTLSADSTLNLSGDLHLSALNDEALDYGNINFNGFTIYINGEPL